jgi:hypothetical protein
VRYSALEGHPEADMVESRAGLGEALPLRSVVLVQHEDGLRRHLL